jgi:release factor glutamine methyltransferase
LNDILQDNKVSTMRDYLRNGLLALYEEREVANISALLFESILGWNRSDLILSQSAHISESEMLRFHFALKKLKQGIPVQYVLGQAWFMGLEFIVNPSVLIPRPETEELVALILQDKTTTEKAIQILDVGTGSGCIAITLAAALPKATIHAVDVSPEALEVALQNAEKNGVNISFMQCDILQDLPQNQFDIIVSNPPYIPEKEEYSMPRQVAANEPHLALFTPDDNPLLFYKRLLSERTQLLRPSGKLYFEIHENFKPQLEEFLSSEKNIAFTFHQDMQNKWRMLEISFI